MKNLLSVFLLFTCISFVACNSISSKNVSAVNDSAKIEIVKVNVIDKDSILKIAEKDAKNAYRDLTIYKVRAELKEDKWYVDYDLTDPQMCGGGPHYVICAKSGTILNRKYEQ